MFPCLFSSLSLLPPLFLRNCKKKLYEQNFKSLLLPLISGSPKWDDTYNTSPFKTLTVPFCRIQVQQIRSGSLLHSKFGSCTPYSNLLILSNSLSPYPVSLSLCLMWWNILRIRADIIRIIYLSFYLSLFSVSYLSHSLSHGDLFWNPTTLDVTDLGWTQNKTVLSRIPPVTLSIPRDPPQLTFETTECNFTKKKIYRSSLHTVLFIYISSIEFLTVSRDEESFTLPPCPYFGSRLLSSFFFLWGSP